MYTLPKFDSEKAAISQSEYLRISTDFRVAMKKKQMEKKRSQQACTVINV